MYIKLKIPLLLPLLFMLSCSIGLDLDGNITIPDKSPEYQSAAYYLENYFIFRDSLPENIMAFDTIENMYASVTEPYTHYYNPEISEDIWSLLTTTSGGTGVELDSTLTGYLISDVVPGSPGDVAGLLLGDTVISIDESSCVGISRKKLDTLVNGDIGDSKIFAIIRPSTSSILNKTVTIDSYLGRSVYVDSLADSIAYIHLSTFSQTTYLTGGSSAEFKQALDSTAWASWTIFDLRQNGGGELTQCIDITSEFIDSGVSLMNVREREMSDDGSFFTQDTCWRSNARNGAVNRKFYILMDNHSASASEILISSLKSNRLDIVSVGTRTYGKARGQIFASTLENGIARVTTMTMFPVVGDWYDEVGIVPDIEISDPTFAIDTAIARIVGISEITSRESNICNKSRLKFTNRQNTIFEPLLYIRK